MRGPLLELAFHLKFQIFTPRQSMPVIWIQECVQVAWEVEVGCECGQWGRQNNPPVTSSGALALMRMSEASLQGIQFPSPLIVTLIKYALPLMPGNPLEAQAILGWTQSPALPNHLNHCVWLALSPVSGLVANPSQVTESSNHVRVSCGRHHTMMQKVLDSRADLKLVDHHSPVQRPVTCIVGPTAFSLLTP